MIYHLVLPDVWEKLIKTDKTEYRPESLETEGFIHCSSKEQVIPTATLYFKDFSELVVLEIVEKRVKNILKWESSRDEELFPHLYGPLPLKDVETFQMLLKTPSGAWEWV